MLITKTIGQTRDALAPCRLRKQRIALVTTMGALHAGHIALVETAKTQADYVVCTIFINPSQFENHDDLNSYPRSEAKDLARLRKAGVDLVFTPETGEIYPDGDETIVETTVLANRLHGALRPGHFRGVSTVVARFFNIIRPDCAVFGEKDYQQLQIIKRMVCDLAFGITIIAVPTVRARDGLALSSRNARLSQADRAAAPVLYRALLAAQALADKTVQNLHDIIHKTIAQEPRAVLKGLDIVAADSLNTLNSGPLEQPAAIMLSVAFGDTLLIDQKVIIP